MNVPIIKLEVEGMRHTVTTALSQHSAEIDENIRKAINFYCSPDNIENVIHKEVTEAIDNAVKEEIRSFFKYSKPGRQAIREAVMKYLDEEMPVDR